MLDSEKIDFLADFLSGSGEIGKILLRQKGRFDYAAASVFPAGANNLDFRWGLIQRNENMKMWKRYVESLWIAPFCHIVAYGAGYLESVSHSLSSRCRP